MTALEVLQEWEGYVVEVRQAEFVARLIDLTARSSHEDEEATFPISVISEEDLERLQPGMVFRWLIGHERTLGGSMRGCSKIVFQDLARMNDADLREGRAWAREITRSLAHGDS